MIFLKIFIIKTERIDKRIRCCLLYTSGGQAHFKAMRKLAAEHESEKVGKEIRKLYSWSDEDKLINN